MNFKYLKQQTEIILNLAMEIIDECTELSYSLDENCNKFRGEVIENKKDMAKKMPKMSTYRGKEERTPSTQKEMDTDLSMQAMRLPVFRLSTVNGNAETNIKCTTEMKLIGESKG